MIQDNSQEISTTEGDPFAMLSDLQWRFVTVMIDNPKFSKADGARALAIEPNTVYKWGDYVNQALEMARRDMHRAALTVRKNALLKAMRVKLALLDSDDEKVRDKAATDVLEWELGKANQPLSGTVDLSWRAVVDAAKQEQDGDDSDSA